MRHSFFIAALSLRVLIRGYGLNLLTHGDSNLHRRTLAIDGKYQLVADGGLAHDVHKLSAGGNFLTVHMGDNVVDLDAGSRSRGVVCNSPDCSALGQAITLVLRADGGDG